MSGGVGPRKTSTNFPALLASTQQLKLALNGSDDHQGFLEYFDSAIRSVKVKQITFSAA